MALSELSLLTFGSTALVFFAAAVCSAASGAHLLEVRTVDDEHVMVHVQDGYVKYKDDGKGPGAFQGHESAGGDEVVRFEPPLNTEAAAKPQSFTIRSSDDSNYANGAVPAQVFRKTKVNGAPHEWPEPPYTLEHTLYLKLPSKLQQGKHYTLEIAPDVSVDTPSKTFTFDAFSSLSEALHVNIIGYNPDHKTKSADLYMWLGDGGQRDYSDYVGRPVTLVNVATGEKHAAGKVGFWKKAGQDYGNWNLTGSDVWTCDFSDFTTPGTYRLTIEGIGCSPEFKIARDAYYEPFRLSVVGFFYMRIGADKDFTPVPRQPRFIPGKDPQNFQVYLTTFGPWHPDWRKMSGDVWDRTDWSKYKEEGSPTNPNAWGGHSDACDWDRHAGHISISYDMLLPYFLSNGKISEDNLGIPESGNGIPDIIDEARYEIDFWLRLRDGKGGYSFGLNNPPKEHNTMYQAAARPYMAWANAANCAMLADCFRIAGKTDLMNQYRDEAIKAYEFANEEDLDFKFGIGNGVSRGRDLKMMAAAFLYNVTGDRKYEDAMAKESVVTGPASEIDNKDTHCQFWGTAAYLMCAREGWQEIHYPDLVKNMKAAVLNEATNKIVNPSNNWPSRRGSDTAMGWFQATIHNQIAIIAHAFSDDAAAKESLLKAMILEADYSQGRNPLNMAIMTGLGSRHPTYIYTSGRNDGTPGVHPGHTPYMNSEPWGNNPQGAYMSNPRWYASKGYPDWKQWPQGEALWHTPHCYSNNEFTPQQTMRGKTALLGYLYSLGESAK